MTPRAAILSLVLATCLAAAGQSARAATMAWEAEFSDGQVLAPGTQVTVSGVVLDFTRSVVQDNDGGDPDLFLFGSDPDFFWIDHGPMGAHAGYGRMAFDNQNDDPADFLQLTISFNFAVAGLQFSLLDIDSGGNLFGATWDDGVEVTYNGGQNIRSDPTSFSFPGAAPTVILDNEPGYEGFEAINGQSAGTGSNNGNVDIDFGLTPITDVTIRYFSTDDAQANPVGQILGISDITWLVSLPEPGTGALLGLGLVLLAASRRVS